MTIMSYAQITELAASVGFPNPELAAAIAMAESNGGNTDAYGDAQYGGSYGLWQINHPAHPNYDIDSLYDPTYNAKAAFEISNGGTNFKPWTTYRTGAYLAYYKPGTPWPPGMGAPIFAILAGAGYLTRDMWLPLFIPIIHKVL